MKTLKGINCSKIQYFKNKDSKIIVLTLIGIIIYLDSYKIFILSAFIQSFSVLFNVQWNLFHELVY